MSNEVKDAPTGLALLMVPFDAHEVGKLPKPTKAQTDAVKANFKEGVRCDICGAWHHPKVVHLDYVGHAALTKRLLQVDLHWSWEPMALTPEGAPLIDQHGGMWIRLTICGMTRIGYGHADGKTGGDAIKEAVGDALRNAALRFGAALELWHKGDLYDVDELKGMGVDAAPPPNPNAVNKRTGQPVNNPHGKPSPESDAAGIFAAAKSFAQVQIDDLGGMKNAHQMAALFATKKSGLDRLAQAYPGLWRDVFLKRITMTTGEVEIENALAEQHQALMQIAGTDVELHGGIMRAVAERLREINPFSAEARDE